MAILTALLNLFGIYLLFLGRAAVACGADLRRQGLG